MTMSEESEFERKNRFFDPGRFVGNNEEDDKETAMIHTISTQLSHDHDKRTSTIRVRCSCGWWEDNTSLPGIEYNEFHDAVLKRIDTHTGRTNLEKIMTPVEAAAKAMYESTVNIDKSGPWENLPQDTRVRWERIADVGITAYLHTKHAPTKPVYQENNGNHV